MHWIKEWLSTNHHAPTEVLTFQGQEVQDWKDTAWGTRREGMGGEGEEPVSREARNQHSRGTANPRPNQICHSGLLVLTAKGYVARQDKKSLKQKHKWAQRKRFLKGLKRERFPESNRGTCTEKGKIISRQHKFTNFFKLSWHDACMMPLKLLQLLKHLALIFPAPLKMNCNASTATALPKVLGTGRSSSPWRDTGVGVPASVPKLNPLS